jgi:hypothetical protein
MEGDPMADDRSREEQNADAREYEPPTLTPLGRIAELTATDGGSIDNPN